MKALKTELLDRVLRFDGVSEVDASEVVRLLLLGVPASKIRVTSTNVDIEAFNRQVADGDQVLPVKAEPISVDLGWEVPEPYLSLDLSEHMFNVFATNHPTYYTEKQYDTALKRVVDELQEVRSRGMTEFMRTVIYVLDMFRKHGVVWGVGRGSSCASYLLFLIGLHAVDCVKYDVPMEEFYH